MKRLNALGLNNVEKVKLISHRKGGQRKRNGRLIISAKSMRYFAGGNYSYRCGVF
jgi:hypothetical protein